jgi:serine/threonine-protein kinase RsbW
MSGPDDLVHEMTSEPQNLAAARDCVRAWAAAHGWHEHQTADIVLAVDEALTNVIRHGYKSCPGCPIHLRVQALADAARGEGIEITIRDKAQQVPLEKICGRDLDDLRPGGLGVHLIRSLMDFAEYSHAAGGGMQLVMKKYKSTSQEQP